MIPTNIEEVFAQDSSLQSEVHEPTPVGDRQEAEDLKVLRANDKQISGTHYKRLSPEPWDVIMAWDLDYLTGSAIKYLSRWKNKGGVQDIKKAIHFLEKLIEEEEKK